MRASTVFSLCAAVATASAATQDAPVISSNPAGVTISAELPDSKNVRGSFVFQTAKDGKGVDVKVSVSGLPATGGPFMYHIHEKAVPADGNCTGTGAHLDPYVRGEAPPCDPKKPETCQTGDLSGKHGNFTAESASAEYNDMYIATLMTDKSYFGGLSVVVHNSTKARLSCANLTIKAAGAGTTASASGAMPTMVNGTGIKTPSGPSPTAPPQNTNAAQKMVAGAGALAVAAAAFLL